MIWQNFQPSSWRFSDQKNWLLWVFLSASDSRPSPIFTPSSPPAGGTTDRTWCDCSSGVAVSVIWKKLPLMFCNVIFFNQTSIQLLLWSFQQCVLSSQVQNCIIRQKWIKPSFQILLNSEIISVFSSGWASWSIPTCGANAWLEWNGFRRIWNRCVTPVVIVRLSSGVCQRRMVRNLPRVLSFKWSNTPSSPEMWRNLGSALGAGHH